MLLNSFIQNFFITIKMISSFKKLDLFSVNFHPHLGERSTFKSFIGALLTIIVYTLSFLYLIYICLLWSNGELLPKITSQQTIIEQAIINFDISPLKLNILKLIPNQPEPFSKKNNILTPILIQINSNKFSPPRAIFTNETDSNDFMSNNLIPPIDKIQIDLKSTPEKSDHQLFLMILIRCNQKYLPEDAYCASDDEIEAFLSIPLIRIYLQISVQQFNPDNQKRESYYKPYYLPLDRNGFSYTQLSFRTANLHINDGFLFKNNKQAQYYTNVEVITQALDQQYAINWLQVTSYASFFITIDSIQDQIFISYPSLGEVLAQVGSIVSMLLMVKIIAKEINTQFLEKGLIDKIIGITFPEFKNIKIQKNILGRIKKVINKDQVEFDIVKFARFYKQAYETSKNKLDIIYQVWSIIKIQTLLSKILMKNELHEMLDESNQKNPVISKKIYSNQIRPINDLNIQDYEEIKRNIQIESSRSDKCLYNEFFPNGNLLWDDFYQEK